MGFHGIYPLVMTNIAIEMAIEIVGLPMKNGWIFHSYVSLPEGKRGINVGWRWDEDESKWFQLHEQLAGSWNIQGCSKHWLEPWIELNMGTAHTKKRGAAVSTVMYPQVGGLTFDLNITFQFVCLHWLYKLYNIICCHFLKHMKHFQLKSRASMRASISHVRARDARAFQTRARETREHFRHAHARRASKDRRARACLKCSRARAAHPAAGEAPYMNPYVLNQAKLYGIYT